MRFSRRGDDVPEFLDLDVDYRVIENFAEMTAARGGICNAGSPDFIGIGRGAKPTDSVEKTHWPSLRDECVEKSTRLEAL